MIYFIFAVILNWSLKLFVAWLMYLLADWLTVPVWAMVAMVAVGAVETRISFANQWNQNNG